MTDFDPDKYIADESDGEIDRREFEGKGKYDNASELLSDKTGRPEEEFKPDDFDIPDFDEQDVKTVGYRTSESVCEFIQSAMNDGKEELAERALRTAVEKGWTEAWFQQSDNVTEKERPLLSKRVCEQDFEEWWRMNYE